MRTCVVGSGRREHALADALARTSDLVVVPGNPGMEGFECREVAPETVEADLWVIGPEAPLAEGLADRLRARGGLVFGPGQDGARLEGSKAWMKELLAAARVPSAPWREFSDFQPAYEYLRATPGPWAVKTDGLAAGKGVLVTGSLEEAAQDVAAKLSGQAFGDAGRRVVIEEALVGQELSAFAICDGRSAYPVGAAQDYKRVGDGGTGPNTGGMGSYSPVPFAGEHLMGQVMERAILPTLHALRKRGIDYRGALYAGLMLTEEGLKVLEFNVRFGDPEAQVLMPRWTGDVTASLAAAASGALSDHNAPTFSSAAAVCVVLASPGYPLEPRSGDRIEGLAEARSVAGAVVYTGAVASAPGPGAGGQQELVTAGGRVLDVVGTASELPAARQLAYRAASMVSWPGMVYRSDIAADA
ncbi:MAG TPA: phosphoribosylamine--glycine ligase [Acidimicrobiales bacterium]|nr:phosphoribosylamine--glycine ligase [Acidimicrobiales bacterium]